VNIEEVTSIAATVLLSLGGGGAIVFGLSNWLGKVWADRMMEKERHVYAKDLEALRDALRLQSDLVLAELRTKLEIAKEALVGDHVNRVTTYRDSVEPVVKFVAKVQMLLIGKRPMLSTEELTEFESQRLHVYAHLSMHAPQEVMDAHDQLIDEMMAVVYDKKDTTWPVFRDLALRFLNEVRKDIGIRPEPIVYRGAR